MDSSQDDDIRDTADIPASSDVVEVVGEEFRREIEFLALKAIEIDRKYTQLAMSLTEEFRKVSLEGAFPYVRMCKPINEERILMIYGRCNDTPFSDELRRHGIEIHAVHTVNVPKWPPYTIEQYKEWSVHWPLRYLKPSFTPLKITASVRSQMLGIMSELMQECREEGGRAVCYITFKNRIIAKAVDKRKDHILSHAALLAVRKVAEMQSDDPKSMSMAKRRFTGAQTDRESREPLQSDLEIPDYLCTQCSVFISHEPCCMCAMALLHSRVASVTYFYPNPDIGALGSVHSLHNTAKLNHHFRAFRIKSK